MSKRKIPKGPIYKTVIRLTALRGAETWPILKNEQKKNKPLDISPIQDKMREVEIDKLQETALFVIPMEQRLSGRPRKRWIDCLLENMKIMSLRPADVQNRILWRSQPD